MILRVHRNFFEITTFPNTNSLAHEDLGHFEEAHHWNIQAKFYNEKFPLVYETDIIGDSLS